MSRSHGTGYPAFFRCTTARRENRYWSKTFDRRDAKPHIVSLTGRTRPTPRSGKGHPRKSWTTREWVCSCGATGWSSHIDLERLAESGKPSKKAD